MENCNMILTEKGGVVKLALPPGKTTFKKPSLVRVKILYEYREKVIKLFNDCSKIVSEAKYKTKYGEGLKILTPKQMLQRLSIALAQVEARNTSENLLNEIRQIIHSLYRAKEITEKVYDNIMNSVQL